MKKKITIITISLIMFLILGVYFSSISNAAIEIKGGIAHTGINASTAYQYCYDMRSSTSTLGNNSLDPHLTLNADWGAVVYLSASAYGSARGLEGYTSVFDPKSQSYPWLTTNNITGVMNLGRTPTITAAFVPSPDDEWRIDETGKNLKINRNTKYVEELTTTYDIASTKGQALAEVDNWWNRSYNYPHGPYWLIAGRIKNLGIQGYEGFDGVTYRPVIWN